MNSTQQIVRDFEGHKLVLGNRVIIMATGDDGKIVGIDSDGRIYVDVETGAVRGEQEFFGHELQWWWH